jgi:simple sugar transport system substrate-binding protein
VGQTVAKYKLRDKGLKVAGGFDLVPETLAAVKNGDLDYTIDQQPYLQGFLPVLALYLFRISGGLLFPTQTNTGLLFVTKDNVDPYQGTKTRYQGSDTAVKLVERSGPITHP